LTGVKTLENLSRKLSIAEIFCGIGAFSEALKQMNIKKDIEFACDWDKAARDTFLINNPLTKRFYSDVFTIRESGIKYNDLDILLLSPPCVEFSKINYQRNLQSDTANLVYEPLRLLEEGILNPKIVLFENVDNLLSIDNGKSFNTMLEVMKSLNYNISYKLVNANLFSATNRNRLFIVMTRKDIPEYEWQPLPNKIDSGSIMDHLEDINSKYLDVNKSFTKTNTKVSKNGLKKIAKLDNMTFEQSSLVYDPNYKSCCITASDAPRILIDDKVRKLSIKEQLSIMGFRKDFKINLSHNKATEKIGNSISVDVLKYLIKPMIEILNK
jgi:DNA (cytosine-5)-methyltransferase 1